MLRDEYKDLQYFEKLYVLYKSALEEAISSAYEVLPEYAIFHMQDLVEKNEILLKLGYSLGENDRFFGSLNSNHELDREGFSQLIVGITNLADDLQDLSELLLEISDEIDGISGIE